MNVLRALPHHSESGGPYDSIWQWWKMEDSKRPRCYLYLLLYASVNGQRNRGLHLCIPPFLTLSFVSHPSLVCACLLSIHILSVSPPLLSLLSAISLSLAPGARWWERMCAGLEEHASGIYTASRMKDSWCSQGCVWVRVCLCMRVCLGVGWGRWGGTGKREQGETEKKGRRVGYKGTECETNWWSTAGLTLQPTIILTAALHIFSDATSLFI